MADSILTPHVLQLLRAALHEDIGPGDLTSRYFIPPGATTRARIFAKEPGSTAGIDLAARVFIETDPTLSVHIHRHDSAPFEAGDTLLQIAGRTASILTAERTALNFLQRLCAIATHTRACVEAVRPHPVQILDTRKTTPGWRTLEKHAVTCGGGANHRMGLHDRILVKDNHLLAADRQEDLQRAITTAKTHHPHIPIQLEADTLPQVRRFLLLHGIDAILLDNMPPAQLREAAALCAGRLQTEASGGITLANLPEIAATGVNAISLGALTHTVRAIDLSLELLR